MNKTLIKIIMPSEGDMQLVNQEGGTITLAPTYFGGECAGPVVQIVDSQDQKKILASYRVKIKNNGDVKLAKAEYL